MDELVLRSNNWYKYEPDIILIEGHLDFDALEKTSVYNYLKSKGYYHFAKTLRTCIYRKRLPV